jgi:dihydroxyacetone kinase-like protein
MNSVQPEDLVAWLKALQVTYRDHKDDLTELDSAIGDADHGINMDRGFTAVKAELDKGAGQDPGTVLKAVAMTLIRTVGGASGPLYGTFFLRASTACSGKSELVASDVVEMFEAGVMGVRQRGKAELDDKTMIDALSPALEAMRQAQSTQADITEMLRLGTLAAEEGMKHTIPLQAKKGRASYLGERSIGHQDPGATSSFLLLQTAYETWSTTGPGNAASRRAATK